MNRVCSQPDPAELLRGIHAALDLIERNLNRLPWCSETGSHIDLVVQLRNRIIASYPHEASTEVTDDTVGSPAQNMAAPAVWPGPEEPLPGSG